MAGKRRVAPLGVPDAPDVVDEHLERWDPVPLRTGFAIEDVHVDAAADLAHVDATSGRIARSRLVAVGMAASRLRSVSMVDVTAGDVDASNADWTGARLKRVVFDSCRMTGLGAAELDAEHVLFRGCKLDFASFRFARISRTTFEDCVLHEADFTGATLSEVRFSGTQLARVVFEKTKLQRVDLRGSELDELRGDILALRGAIIDSVQLVALAAPLAQAVGITVEDK